MSCMAPGCKNNFRNSPAVSFFTFPKDERRQKWIDFCKNEEINLNTARICSKHFSEEDFKSPTERLQVLEKYLLKPRKTLQLNSYAIPKNCTSIMTEKVIDASEYIPVQIEEVVDTIEHSNSSFIPNLQLNLKRLTSETVNNSAINKKIKLDVLDYSDGELIWAKTCNWNPAISIDIPNIEDKKSQHNLWVYGIITGEIFRVKSRDDTSLFFNDFGQRNFYEFFNNDNMVSRKKNKNSLLLLKFMEEHFETLKIDKSSTDLLWKFFNDQRITNNGKIVLKPYPEEINFKLKQRNMNRYCSNSRFKIQDVSAVFNAEIECVPISAQKIGLFIVAKLDNKTWIPGVIVDYQHLQKPPPAYAKQYIICFPNFEIYQIRYENVITFNQGMKLMKDNFEDKKSNLTRIFAIAAREYCLHHGYIESEYMGDAIHYFFDKVSHNIDDTYFNSKSIVKSETGIYSKTLSQYLKNMITDSNYSCKRECMLLKDNLLTKPAPLDSVCLVCFGSKSVLQKHPFFEGFICLQCFGSYKTTVFAISNGGKNVFCVMCGDNTSTIECDKVDCPRIFCVTCLKYIICPKSYTEVILDYPWHCFICKYELKIYRHSRIQIRVDWRAYESLLYNNEPIITREIGHIINKKKLRVFSAFDGISGALCALDRNKIVPEVYFACEVDEEAIEVSDFNHPGRITRFDSIKGDITEITEEDIKKIVPINLLIGGSPCQDLSSANPDRGGLLDGKSKLFFDFVNILNWITKHNPSDEIFFFLFENVASMREKDRKDISFHLKCEPRLVDAIDFSAMHRARLIWDNLPKNDFKPLKKELQEYLTPKREALVKKVLTITTQKNSLRQGKYDCKPVLVNKIKLDDLKMIEIEKLFGLPLHYTDVGLLDATRLRMVANGFSIDMFEFLLNPLKYFFLCSE